MSRHNLTDLEWNAIRVLLPKERTGKAGRPWIPHRRVIDGILFVLRTGIPWADLPSQFGKFKTVYNRFRRWVKNGLWQRIFNALIDRLQRNGEIDFELWCVDGTIVRAHRVASGAPSAGRSNDENAEKHALGRSRGGYSTKLHFLTDGQGIPISVIATPGQRKTKYAKYAEPQTPSAGRGRKPGGRATSFNSQTSESTAGGPSDADWVLRQSAEVNQTDALLHLGFVRSE